MTTEATFEGGCLCTAVRWRASCAPTRVVHCHCEMCRRSSGAAFITAAAFPLAAVQWERGEPTWYQSSPEASRGFCARCGSWLSWRRGEEIWLTVGTFDHPEAVVPQEHHMVDAQLSWVRQLEDGLPRHAGLQREPAAS
ncbi:MAG: GFA family protein [Gammaproteobacteria bacterium]|nr:GFA family protein [Gammaproteobacteria bacterium]